MRNWRFCLFNQSLFSTLFIGAALACCSTLAQPVSTNAAGLTLNSVLRRVIEYNESVQMQMLETEIRHRLAKAEKGVFEPQVVSSIEHQENIRQNNIQQQLSLLGTPVLRERDSIYSGGLDLLSPIGTQLHMGYTLRDLRNNLGGRLGGTNQTVQQYESFAGGTLVQPILKNFGATATMVRLRLASVASDLAFQDYRRQLMLVIAQSESGYWDLYLTQEQERISNDSVTIAGKILKDNRARQEVGRSPELEVLEAQSGLALREARLNEAKFRRLDAANRLSSFISGQLLDTNLVIRATDLPVVKEAPASALDNYEKAFTLNPDYLSRRKQVEQENIRLAFAKNQRLPQLDLKASYGLNGLGATPSDSLDSLQSTEFPTWAVGFEMRIPVLGGIKERNELAAARLSKKKALVGLKEIEIQISNAIEAGLQKVRSYRETIVNRQNVAKYYQNLLDTQLTRLDVGASDSRTVLETEEKTFQAKIDQVESQVLYEKALLDLELVSGSVLSGRGVEITKAQLQERTAELLHSRRWSDFELAKVQRDLVKEYQEARPNPNATPNEMAERYLRKEMEKGSRAAEPPTLLENQARDKAQEVLRDYLKQNRP